MRKDKIIRSEHFYVRKEVESDVDNLYIFTDNTDRDSGHNNIDNNSKYSQKYGKNLHYPMQTTALIRGLNNAVPITTQRFYHGRLKGINGRWTDEDYEEFKKVIDEDFENIIQEWNSGKYKHIIFPMGGIFNSKISNISKERVPKLYDYLFSKCLSLYDI